MNTPSIELISNNRFPELQPITSREFNSLIDSWRREKSAASAMDIMDAGIASGSRQLAVEGARRLLTFPSNFVQDRILERANAILFHKAGHIAASSLPAEEENEEDLHRKVADLKRSIMESPRNTLAHVEIARLYSRLGQFRPAEHHMRLAMAISPDDRFVLRAATRLFTILDNHQEIIRILWATDSIKHDQWIQSAELAVATLEGMNTRYAQKTARSLEDIRKITKDNSELIAGWISRKAGNKRATKNDMRALAKSLTDPTENALAQAIWMNEKSGREFSRVFPDAKFSSDAHEAKSLKSLEELNIEFAIEEGKKWFIDQPFQVRSSINLAFIYYLFHSDFENCLAVANRGLFFHPTDWLLLNYCVISAARLNRLDSAMEYLARLERAVDGSEAQAFLDAAKGAIAFQKGQFESGVSYYVSAARLSRSNGRGDLALNAAVYLLEMLAVHGLALPEDVAKLSGRIDRALKALPLAQQKDMRITWHQRQLVIARCMDEWAGPTIGGLAYSAALTDMLPGSDHPLLDG